MLVTLEQNQENNKDKFEESVYTVIMETKQGVQICLIYTYLHMRQDKIIKYH